LVEGASVSFFLGISPGGYQHACSGNSEDNENIPRIVDVFYREIDTKAILVYFVLLGLFPRSTECTRIRRAWSHSKSEFLREVSFRSHVFLLYKQTHQECEDPDNQCDSIGSQLTQTSDIHGLMMPR
jgi:hypothetical protein